MDLFSKLTLALVNYAEGLSPQTIRFWLRLLFVLVLPVAASAWTFNGGFRSVFVQVAAGVLGLLLALSLPLQRVEIPNGMVRVWLLTFVLLAVTFSPAVLPRLLLPTLGGQKRLRNALILAVAALIAANLLWG